MAGVVVAAVYTLLNVVSYACRHAHAVGLLVGQAFVRRSFGCLTCILSFALFFIAYTYL